MIEKKYHKNLKKIYDLLVINTKVILKLVKKIIFSFCLLFGLNVVIKSLGIIIPINVLNVLLVTFLGVPGLIGILLIKVLII